MPTNNSMKTSTKEQLKTRCDVCCGNIDKGHDKLVCEGGCGCSFHRDCGGVTVKHYDKLLTAGSPPFVCQYCTLTKCRTEVVLLKEQVDSLKTELEQVKKLLQVKEKATSARVASTADARTTYAAVAASLNSSNTTNFNQKIARPTKNRKKRELHSSVGSSNSEAADTQHKIEQTETENDEYMQLQRVPGARKIWGTLRKTTVRRVFGALTKMMSEKPGLKIKRKEQSGTDKYKPRWWFVIRADEADLLKLEEEWNAVYDETSWKLLPVFKSIGDTHSSSGNANPASSQTPKNIPNSSLPAGDVSQTDDTPSEDETVPQ